MQPIALNIAIIQELISDWSNYKKQREFHKLVENLEKFHIISIDNINNKSLWFQSFSDFRKSIKNDNILKMIDELLGPKNIKYIIYNIDKTEDYFYELVSATPDKIGIDISNKSKDKLKLYDLPTFNSNKYDLKNFLFRIPKTIKIYPDRIIDDLRIFTPYLRNAKLIEFCDYYLFKKGNIENELFFITTLADLSSNLEEIVFYLDKNPLNVNLPLAEKKIRDQFGDKITCRFKDYLKKKNHDRFIIIDQKKFSMRFTSSFNNFFISDSGYLKSKCAFEISISEGREYLDS